MDLILDNEFAALTLLYGILFIITGVLYKLFPPKRMIGYHGVQTKAARRGEDCWKEANRFVATPALTTGILFSFLSLLPLLLKNAGFLNSRFAFLLIFASLYVLHFATTRHLNKLFDKEGNRISSSTPE